MIKQDPSEAADSERILECVTRYFPGVEITLTGGVVYHLALSDVLANIDEEEDAKLLALLLILDDMFIELGETHYATALAFKEKRLKRAAGRFLRFPASK